MTDEFLTQRSEEVRAALTEGLMAVHNHKGVAHLKSLTVQQLHDLALGAISLSYGLLLGLAEATGQDLETEILPGFAAELWTQHYNDFT